MNEYAVVIHYFCEVDGIWESDTSTLVATSADDAARYSYIEHEMDGDAVAVVTNADGKKIVVDCAATRDCRTEVVDMDPPVTPLPTSEKRKQPPGRVTKAQPTVYVRAEDDTVLGKWPDGMEGRILSYKDSVRDYTKEEPSSWWMGRVTYREIEVLIGKAEGWISSTDAALIEESTDG